MSDTCGDNRLELIEKYKQKLLDATNIGDSPEEMAVIDNILFRFWQMGWIKGEPSAQQWIPCSERLPEESGRYLISVLDGVGRRTTVAPYQPRYKAWTMTGRMAYWKVIAWMPLPEPAKIER